MELLYSDAAGVRQSLQQELRHLKHGTRQLRRLRRGNVQLKRKLHEKLTGGTHGDQYDEYHLQQSESALIRALKDDNQVDKACFDQVSEDIVDSADENEDPEYSRKFRSE